MDITEITSALSDAAPYAGAITALANLGIDITKLVSPSEQDYDTQFQNDCKKGADLVTALVENPNVDTATALSTFDDELLADTGRPVVGGIPTDTVAVRVDRLLAHICDSAELKLYRKLFAQLADAGGKPAQQQAPISQPQ